MLCYDNAWLCLLSVLVLDVEHRSGVGACSTSGSPATKHELDGNLKRGGTSDSYATAVAPMLHSVNEDPVLPREIDEHVGFFDRFATKAAHFVGRAPFFAACVALVVLWVPSYFIFQDLEIYQLIINTATTIVTFLLVALIQNTEARSNAAIQHKLNAIAFALADVMAEFEMDDDREELESAIGLEKRETSN